MSSDRTSGPTWRRIGDDEVDAWNARLRSTSAHLYQYPIWNEPLRAVHFTPVYGVGSVQGEDRYFACLLGLNAPGMKFGVLRCGPVSLDDDATVPAGVVDSLLDFAAAEGFICVRFSTRDATLRDSLAPLRTVVDEDLVPQLAHHDHELVVPQMDDADAQLAALRKKDRYQIRKAPREGYVFRRAEDPGELRSLWRICEAMDERKGHRIYARPFESYQTLLDRAYAHGIGDLYVVDLEDTAVQFLAILRSRDTAFYALGALDVDAVGSISPSYWAHWQAMRLGHEQGVSRYHLGNEGDENMKAFKYKLNPEKIEYQPAFTAVLKPIRYAAFKATFPVAALAKELTDQVRGY